MSPDILAEASDVGSRTQPYRESQLSAPDAVSTDRWNHSVILDEVFDRLHSQLARRWIRVVGVPLLAGLVLFVAPVAAQPADPICDASNLPGIIEGFFQITTALGLMGLVIVWQADVIAEIFTLDPDQRKGFKRHRRTAGKSAAIVTALGPLYMVAGTIMGLPLADCVNLAPW